MPLCARSPGLSCELSLIGHHSRSGNLGAACALLPLSVLTNCARSLLRLAAIVRIAMWLRRSLYASRHADANVWIRNIVTRAETGHRRSFSFSCIDDIFLILWIYVLFSIIDIYNCF